MWTSRYGVVALMAISLYGCSSDRLTKPILTADASYRIAKLCGAVKSEYHRNKFRLPEATFILKPNGVLPDNGVSPVVSCIGRQLDNFQHSGFSFRSTGLPSE